MNNLYEIANLRDKIALMMHSIGDGEKKIFLAVMHLLGCYELNYTTFTNKSVERHFLMFKRKEKHPLIKLLMLLSFKTPKIAYLECDKSKIMLNHKNKIEFKSP